MPPKPPPVATPGLPATPLLLMPPAPATGSGQPVHGPHTGTDSSFVWQVVEIATPSNPLRRHAALGS